MERDSTSHLQNDVPLILLNQTVQDLHVFMCVHVNLITISQCGGELEHFKPKWATPARVWLTANLQLCRMLPSCFLRFCLVWHTLVVCVQERKSGM